MPGFAPVPRGEISRNRSDTGSVMREAHFHDMHELYYLESGEIRYVIGSEIYRLTAGDWVFVPSGMLHLTEGGGRMERLLLTFDDALAGKALAPYIAEMTQRRHIRLSREHLPQVQQLLGRMEIEYLSREPDSLIMQQLYLRELLILLHRHRLPEVAQENSTVRAAARYISENYDQALTLDGLARHFAVSPGYFSKQFKRETGTGVNEYITLTRITAAQQMLASGSLPITQVAMNCGFNDSNYFARVFKQLLGVTPKKYAMQIKLTRAR